MVNFYEKNIKKTAAGILCAVVFTSQCDCTGKDAEHIHWDVSTGPVMRRDWVKQGLFYIGATEAEEY